MVYLLVILNLDTGRLDLWLLSCLHLVKLVVLSSLLTKKDRVHSCKVDSFAGVIKKQDRSSGYWLNQENIRGGRDGVPTLGRRKFHIWSNRIFGKFKFIFPTLFDI